VQNPFAAETAEAAVLLAAEGTVGGIVDAMVVDVGHARLDTQREANAPFRLRVNTADDRPYSVWLATMRASSSSRTRMMGAIGPKISSCAICMSFVNTGKDVRWQHLAVDLASHQLAHTRFARSLDPGKVAIQLLPVDNRTDRDGRILRNRRISAFLRAR